MTDKYKVDWQELRFDFMSQKYIGPFNCTFIGNEEETKKLLLELQAREHTVLTIDMQKDIGGMRTDITGPDGHYHIIQGVPQTHSWDECPENGASGRWYEHEGRVYPEQ